jgi:hypothetical protein
MSARGHRHDPAAWDDRRLLQTVWLLTTRFVCASNLINGHCEFAKQVDDFGVQ